jgi:DNA-binding NtrC family response regulator
MPKTPKAAQNSNQIAVLSIGFSEEDNVGLTDIFACSQWSLSPGSEWRLDTSRSLDTALQVLRRRQVPIVLCERDLEGNSWKDLLEQLALLPEPPHVIVASRLADERLWAEALNLGAYDVLAKPFDTSEVLRVLSSAWLHRVRRGEAAADLQHSNERPRVALRSGYGVA